MVGGRDRGSCIIFFYRYLVFSGSLFLFVFKVAGDYQNINTMRERGALVISCSYAIEK